MERIDKPRDTLTPLGASICERQRRICFLLQEHIYRAGPGWTPPGWAREELRQRLWRCVRGRWLAVEFYSE